MNNSRRICLAASFVLTLFVTVQIPHQSQAETYEHAERWCDNKAKKFAKKQDLSDMYSKIGDLGFHELLGSKANTGAKDTFGNIIAGTQRERSAQSLYNLQYKICMAKHSFD